MTDHKLHIRIVSYLWCVIGAVDTFGTATIIAYPCITISGYTVARFQTIFTFNSAIESIMVWRTPLYNNNTFIHYVGQWISQKFSPPQPLSRYPEGQEHAISPEYVKSQMGTLWQNDWLKIFWHGMQLAPIVVSEQLLSIIEQVFFG